MADRIVEKCTSSSITTAVWLDIRNGNQGGMNTPQREEWVLRENDDWMGDRRRSIYAIRIGLSMQISIAHCVVGILWRLIDGFLTIFLAYLDFIEFLYAAEISSYHFIVPP